MGEQVKANPNNIREMNLETDLGQVAEIWLIEVKRAHLLICDKFWDSRLSVFVRETKDAKERYVWEENGLIAGFITSKENGYILDLYVASQYQRKGIGQKLLKKLEDKYSELTLSVYKQNTKAFDWYTKRCFKVHGVRRCPDTEFMKLEMIWKKNSKEGTSRTK